MSREPFDRCDHCNEPANAGDDRAWYIARYKSSDPGDQVLHIRGTLCDSCSHRIGHGKEAVKGRVQEEQ